MKTLLATLSAAWSLTACVPSTPQARIQQNPGKFAALSHNQQVLIQQGQISRGMSPDAVYFAWGSPSNSFQGSQNGKSTERWDYSSARPVAVTNFYGYAPYAGYGYAPYGRHGHPAVGIAYGPEIAYIPYRVASVWFRDQRVDAWERAR